MGHAGSFESLPIPIGICGFPPSLGHAPSMNILHLWVTPFLMDPMHAPPSYGSHLVSVGPYGSPHSYWGIYGPLFISPSVT